METKVSFMNRRAFVPEWLRGRVLPWDAGDASSSPSHCLSYIHMDPKSSNEVEDNTIQGT